MKKSFTLYVFVRLLLVASIVVYAQRLISRQLLYAQLQDSAVVHMAGALTTCSELTHDQNAFFACARKINPGSIEGYLTEFFIPCGASTLTFDPSQTDLCVKTSGIDDAWTDTKGDRSQQTQYATVEIDQQQLHMVRLSAPGQSVRLLLRNDHVEHLLELLWKVRDKNLIYMMPTFLLMLGLMGWYMVVVVLRPIRKIEQAVSILTAQNLNQAIGVPTPFVEFQTFISVFEDLRQRLANSFTKARRFASDASHELRTPLAILRGNSEQLIAELPRGSEAQVRASRMNEEIDRLIEITEKLLMLSRADANSIVEDPSEVDLSDLLQELIDEADSLQSSVHVTGAIQPHVVWWGDRTLIRQLIHNLYSNALQYNVPHGWIAIHLSAQDSRFLLRIENSSADIPADLCDRAFERFYRGDASHTRQVDGLGLGLSLCLEIVRLHDGKLNLSVTPSHTVCLELEAPLKRNSLVL